MLNKKRSLPLDKSSMASRHKFQKHKLTKSSALFYSINKSLRQVKIKTAGISKVLLTHQVNYENLFLIERQCSLLQGYKKQRCIHTHTNLSKYTINKYNYNLKWPATLLQMYGQFHYLLTKWSAADTFKTHKNKYHIPTGLLNFDNTTVLRAN